MESLTADGYRVDLGGDGNDGLSRGLASEYALMMIDRMLPGIDGITIIRCLRENGVATPALIISALGEVDDRVRGLRAGGDDYLVKPFASAELLRVLPCCEITFFRTAAIGTMNAGAIRFAERRRGPAGSACSRLSSQ